MLCSRCDYDLTGLPAEHTCPECGCNYDEHSSGIVLTARRNERWAVWLAVPMMAIAAWLVTLRRGAWDSFRHFMVPVAILVGVLVRSMQRAGVLARIVLDRDGVEFITPGQEPLRWEWSNIRRANVDWAWGRFYLVAKDETFLISRSYRRLGSLKLAKHCAAEINDRIARYRNLMSEAPRD